MTALIRLCKSIKFLNYYRFFNQRELEKIKNGRGCLLFKIYFYLFTEENKNKQRERISLGYSFVKAISCAKKLLTLASVKGYSNGLDRENNGRCFPRVEVASWRMCCRGNRKNIFSRYYRKHTLRGIVRSKRSRNIHTYLCIYWRVDSRGCPQYKTQSQRRPSKWLNRTPSTYRWLLSRTLRF